MYIYKKWRFHRRNKNFNNNFISQTHKTFYALRSRSSIYVVVVFFFYHIFTRYRMVQNKIVFFFQTKNAITTTITPSIAVLYIFDIRRIFSKNNNTRLYILYMHVYNTSFFFIVSSWIEQRMDSTESLRVSVMFCLWILSNKNKTIKI